jgi:lipopolysaccharide transport system permease protein
MAVTMHGVARMGDGSTRAVPLVRICAGAGRPAINLGVLVRYFDLLVSLAARDVKVRYKQTVLGVSWVVLQPLLAAVIFSFVFGKVARLPSEGRPYMLFAFAGLLAWNLFSNTVTRSSIALVANAHVVTKVYFPREVLPISAMFSAVLDFGVSLVVMALMLAWYRIWPGLMLILLPLWIAVLVVMALGIGLMAGALMVRFRDVQHMIPTLLSLGLYASPVTWSVSAVPAQYRLVCLLNPLSGSLEAFRRSLLGEGVLSGGALAYSAVTAGLIFWLGAKVFRRMERSFADVL